MCVCVCVHNQLKNRKNIPKKKKNLQKKYYFKGIQRAPSKSGKIVFVVYIYSKWMQNMNLVCEI